jgi:hypothetical protein
VPKDKVPRGTVPPIDPVQSTATPAFVLPQDSRREELRQLVEAEAAPLARVVLSPEPLAVLLPIERRRDSCSSTCAKSAITSCVPARSSTRDTLARW